MAGLVDVGRRIAEGAEVETEAFVMGFGACLDRISDFLIEGDDGGPSLAEVRAFVNALVQESRDEGGEK